MKKSLSLFIALLLVPALFFGASKKKQEVIRIGVEGYWNPYNFIGEDGELTGYDIDVVKAINDRIKEDVTIQIERIAWDGLFLALETGRIDVIANEIKKNPAREQRYLYGAHHYNYDYPVIIFKKDRTDINSAEDLFGKKVIIAPGTSYADSLDNFNSKNGNKVIPVYTGNDVTMESIFSDIISGRGDAAIENPVAAEILIRDKHYPLRYIKLDPELANPAYIIFRKNKRGQHIKELFDAALEEIRADGTLSKLAIKWFGSDTTIKSN